MNSASSLAQQTERDNALAREREAIGRCGRCGQQCFHVKHTGCFPMRLTNRALTIPKLVRNGRCLYCHPEGTPAASSIAPLATPVPATTSGGHRAGGGGTRTGTGCTGNSCPATHTSIITPPLSRPHEQPARSAWVALAMYTAVCVLAGFGLALLVAL